MCYFHINLAFGRPEEPAVVADVLLVDEVEAVDVVLHHQPHHRPVGVPPVLHQPLVDDDPHAAHAVQFIVHLPPKLHL